MKCWVCYGGAISISSILLTSCTIGNGHICGPQTPLIYCDSGANERAMNRKKYMEWWGGQICLQANVVKIGLHVADTLVEIMGLPLIN